MEEKHWTDDLEYSPGDKITVVEKDWRREKNIKYDVSHDAHYIVASLNCISEKMEDAVDSRDAAAMIVKVYNWENKLREIEVSADAYYSGSLMKNIESALDRVREAIEEKEL